MYDSMLYIMDETNKVSPWDPCCSIGGFTMLSTRRRGSALKYELRGIFAWNFLTETSLPCIVL